MDLHKLPSGRLPPWLIQIAGIVVIFGSFVAWWRTGQETTLLIGAGLSMIAYGQINFGDQGPK